MQEKSASRKTVILSVSMTTVLMCFLLVVNQVAAQTEQPEAQPAAQTKQSEAQPAAQTEQPKEQPNIVFEEKTFDFGNIQQGEKVPHVFRFRNEGPDILKINRVRPTCGCTVAKNYTKEVPPGEEGQIELSFNSKRFMGAQRKTIYVYSNDPDEPKIGLTLKGTVTKSNKLFFGLIQQGDSPTKSINVNQTGHNMLEILNVETNLPFINTKVIPEPKNKRNNYKVEVNISADAPEGPFKDWLKIHTNIERDRLMTYEVMGTVKAKVASPRPKKPSEPSS